MRKKASDLLEGLKEYFEQTPQDELKRDLERLEIFNRIGPDVMEYFKSIEQQKVVATMREEVPVLESSSLSEADVRHVIEIFRESSKYFDKKIEEERETNGGSRLGIHLLDGVVDANELAIQYVLHRLNIKND
jgi:hypothetical protein